ncbi:hypothetical protein BN2475_280009 [Paraburkholderia ribeironis]|uniref:Uncharacterized protein n=1 Tax=Paraburkholderia ribeironis TaxID=1247936 RepID=A0A1N7S181_9BURK|nr:hypothetical protein BN2475_280009 [Paraburkholderia ribeironis]
MLVHVGRAVNAFRSIGVSQRLLESQVSKLLSKKGAASRSTIDELNFGSGEQWNSQPT